MNDIRIGIPDSVVFGLLDPMILTVETNFNLDYDEKWKFTNKVIIAKSGNVLMHCNAIGNLGDTLLDDINEHRVSTIEVWLKQGRPYPIVIISQFSIQQQGYSAEYNTQTLFLEETRREVTSYHDSAPFTRKYSLLKEHTFRDTTSFNTSIAADNVRRAYRMIRDGQDVNIPDPGDDRYMTPLSIAVRGYNTRMVRKLLDCGADVNKQNEDGTIAISHTVDAIAHKPYGNMIKLLRYYNADLTTKDNLGRTVKEYAQSIPLFAHFDLLEESEKPRYLSDIYFSTRKDIMA